MRTRFCLLLLAITLTAVCRVEAQWLTDYSTALKRAQAEDKAVLINFTGSDWCGWCIKLKKEVFDTPEFKQFAAESLILLEVDFPREKELSTDQTYKNKKLAKEFGVRGYPTVFIVHKNGARLVKTGYVEGGPEKYIAGLKAAPGFPKRTAEPDRTFQPEPTTSPNNQPPAFAVATPVIRYDNVALKGILGGKTKLALINNQTLAAGEKGKIKVGDKTVEITVKEVRTDSALVQIEGETEARELKLKPASAATP